MEETIENTEKLFVYGIFLGEYTRQGYGMTNPRYATVRDYATFGGHIVQAQHVPGVGFSLTGLLVDIPRDRWKSLDRLEGGYSRVKVNVETGWNTEEEAWMYVAKQ